jgi:glycosyltransferase involved in cell wall biosynthesis
MCYLSSHPNNTNLDPGTSRALRVLILPSWYPPDGGQFFQDHAEGLAEAGFKVDVLVNRLMGITQLKISERRLYKRFRVTDYRGTRIIRSFYLKPPRSEMFAVNRWSISTLKLFKEYQSAFGTPDVILAHSAMWAGYAASLIRKKYGIPYLVNEHRGRFAVMSKEAEALLKPFYRPFLEEAYGNADKIVSVSNALHFGIRKYVPEGTELLSIPNMVDTDFFTLPAPRVHDPFVILSIGRLEVEKGMDLLIEAFDLFAEDHPDAELRIVGKGSREAELREMASRSNHPSRITFVGYLSPESILEELHFANVLAVASRIEAFGVAFVEAMSTGLPVLATKTGGPDSIVPDYAGFLATLESVPSLFVGLKNIYSNYYKYDPQKIRRHVEKNFSKKAVIGKFSDLIHDLCDGRD